MKQLIIVLAVLLASCATQKRCYEKWSMKPDTIRTVEIRDSLVYKDTTVYKYLPGENRVDSVFIPCPPPPPDYIPDTAYAKTSMATAKAWWSYPFIALKLVQHDSLFTLRLDSARKESYHWRTEYDNVTQVLKEKYVPKIYKDALSICIFIFVAMAVWLGFKIKSFFSKK
jgi:hypothetical protein